LGNTQVSFRGVQIDKYVAKVFDDLQAEALTCDDGSCESCAEILAVDPSSSDGVYLVDPDGPDTGYNAFYVYCDITGGGWTLLLRYSSGSGYYSSFNFNEAGVPTSSGGADPPTNQIWCPMPDGADDGHVAITSFDMSGGRALKAMCVDGSGSGHSYTTDLVAAWTAGDFGTANAKGSSTVPVAWGVLAGHDIGLKGRANHYMCGAISYVTEYAFLLSIGTQQPSPRHRARYRRIHPCSGANTYHSLK
jgi:hypothetical protein